MIAVYKVPNPFGQHNAYDNWRKEDLENCLIIFEKVKIDKYCFDDILAACNKNRDKYDCTEAS